MLVKVELVIMAKAGDEDALKTLLDTIKPNMLRLSKGWFFERMDQEDVVQATFIEIWKKLYKPHSNDYFLDWSKGILWRKCYRLRKKQQNWRHLPLEDFQQSLAAAEPYFTEKMREIYNRMLQMEQGLRDTMILRFFYGLPSKGIARIQNIPEGTVRSRIHNAKLHLKNTFSLYEGE